MMSSVGSTPELEARLEGTFGAHLEAVCERSARALTACGYAGLLVHSGSLLGVFEDDRTYPFEAHAPFKVRSEEHTSELQSRLHLVCRLLLEKKKQSVVWRVGGVQRFSCVRVGAALPSMVTELRCVGRVLIEIGGLSRLVEAVRFTPSPFG